MTATPQLMLNRKGYQVSKPEMEFHMINIISVALPMHAQTEKTTFHAKTYIDKAHTALDTFRFAVFLELDLIGRSKSATNKTFNMIFFYSAFMH